jgi:hypothetical protein
LNAATTPLVAASPSASRCGSDPGSNSAVRPAPTPASSSETIGPTTATAYSRAGVCGSSVISVRPARKVTVMLRTGRAKARATTQCPISWSSTLSSSRTANEAAAA